MDAAQLEEAPAAQESHWIPLSDLITGLMVIFLLIALSYMMRAWQPGRPASNYVMNLQS